MLVVKSFFSLRFCSLSDTCCFHQGLFEFILKLIGMVYCPLIPTNLKILKDLILLYQDYLIFDFSESGDKRQSTRRLPRSKEWIQL